MALRKVLSYVVLAALAATSLLAQTTQPAPATSTQPQVAAAVEGGEPQYIKPETAQQRRDRLGTAEDPGTNPDPNTVWWRFGKKYNIHRYERKWARYDVQEGWVRPFAPVNFGKEIYQQNEKYVWVWNEIIDPASIEDNTYIPPPDEEIKYFESVRGEFSDLAPATSPVRIQFEEASNGLPSNGSWRNTLAAADMNEDGFIDLVLPPQRGAENTPSIFLGDGKGNWKLWDIVWPVGFDYGGVAVADFNKDKHLDLAFAVHLNGVAVFLGDGKGKFIESKAGLPMDFPTRRVITTDVNGDGWTDVVAISEGPMVRGQEQIKPTVGGNLRAYLNRKKGTAWEQTDVATMGKYLGGDWLTAANLNGDKYPDFVGASIYFNGVDTVWFSSGDGKTYRENTDRALVPFLSYYSAMTAGRFNKASKTDDVIVGFYRQWPDGLDPKTVPPPPLKQVVGIDRLTFGKDAKRTPLVRWASSRSVWGLGRGDFDGDGNQDLFYTVFDPREAVVLLGDGTGRFRRATVEGIKLPGMINYDITVADVNRDSKPDVIVMYESDETSAFGAKNGKVQVFLNRGTVASDKP